GFSIRVENFTFIYEELNAQSIWTTAGYIKSFNVNELMLTVSEDGEINGAATFSVYFLEDEDEILFDLNVKEQFYTKINEILGQKGVYTIICCSILKEPYIRQYGKLNDVYAPSLSFLMERTVFYLDSIVDAGSADLSIIAEKRGKKEDQNLYDYFINLLDKGTYWVSPERLKNYFKKFIFCAKREDINCLQIADLIAYPVTRHILDPDEVNLSFEIIKENLFYEGGKVRGLKVIPKQ
ncbi:MAG: DUF3800 domain-containing protein, partial [Bacteroidales bacterium]|nr:DUF3800 domain-containing protein [Bacteroidales bacterium]